MVGGGDFVEIRGLALGGKEIGCKLGGAVWWSDFRVGFHYGNIRVRKRGTCRYGLCIDGLWTKSV